MTDFQKNVLSVSEKIMAAQKPIHILDSVKWNEDIFEEFKKSKFKVLPKVGKTYYDKIPLRFNPEDKVSEFEEIQNEISKLIGESEPVSEILHRQCSEYIEVVKMLQARGTPDFYKYSKQLYGSSSDYLRDKVTPLKKSGTLINEILDNLEDTDLGSCYLKNIPSEQVVSILNQKLSTYFKDTSVLVKLDDGILSDASAGSNYIKIKSNIYFSERDVDIFEVHEGWVHVGTTLNGLIQPYAKWLSKGTPSTTSIQEGLAFLMEVFTFRCTPERLRKINNRLLACEMTENGADFIEVFEFFKDIGLSDESAFRSSQRIFRGGLVEGGGPFTKDISYIKGFIMTYNFIRTCIRDGNPHYIPYLFAGKVTLGDIPILYDYSQSGLIDSPKFLPPQFSDLNGIAVWMAFSNFLNKMKLDKIEY